MFFLFSLFLSTSSSLLFFLDVIVVVIGRWLLVFFAGCWLFVVDGVRQVGARDGVHQAE